MTNWYIKNKELLSNQERWICSVMESITKASDKGDIGTIDSLLPVLKNYLSKYNESQSISEKINSFVRRAKNLLLSEVLSPHKVYNKLSSVIWEYENIEL